MCSYPFSCRETVKSTIEFQYTGKCRESLPVVILLQPDYLPQRVSNIQWNCSVPYWPDFQLHLHCNLLAECDSEQDESSCGYVMCRHGGFLFNDTCYFIIQPEHDLLLYEARQLCEAVHGQLATFQLETERVALGQFIYERHKLSLYVGIQATMSGLPAMYARCWP